MTTRNDVEVDGTTKTIQASRRCFVAMPIRKPGSEGFDHYRAIFESIADIVTSRGFEVIRADEISGPGNITRDIVTLLAESGLVIADLSDLNANVFYEIGVRHALRRNGTILMIDESRTPQIPFDLGQYRVIQYRGNLPGVRAMMKALESAVTSISLDQDQSKCDSPVHEWYPELPADVISHGRQSVEPELRDELLNLRREVENYKSQVGRSAGRDSSPEKARSIVEQLRQASLTGGLAPEYSETARAAVQSRDVSGFLDATEKMLSSQDANSEIFRAFSTFADNLGQERLALALLEESTTRFADEPELKRALAKRLAQSSFRDNRGRAKRMLGEYAMVDLENRLVGEAFSIARHISDLGHLLEVLHAEEQDDVGLEILENLARTRPEVGENVDFLRDLARQNSWLDNKEEAFTGYRKCINAAGADQESIRWFANFMHNNGWHVEAAELFTLETFFDLDDANGPINLANEIAFHVYDYFALKRDPAFAVVVGEARDLPDGIGSHTILEGIEIGACSNTLTQSQADSLRRLVERAETPSDPQQWRRWSKDERLSWVAVIYRRLESNLTHGTPIAKRLLDSTPSDAQKGHGVDD